MFIVYLWHDWVDLCSGGEEWASCWDILENYKLLHDGVGYYEEGEESRMMKSSPTRTSDFNTMLKLQ